MAIEIPPSLQWVSYLAGSEWPQGDETAMFRIRDAWHASAADLAALIPELNRVRAQTLSVLFGETANAADAQFALLFDGEFSVDKLADAMSALGDLAGQGGVEIEYTKLQIISALGVAAAEILFAIASVVPTAGASLKAIPMVEALTFAAIRESVALLIKRICGAAASMLAKTAVKRLAERGTHELLRGVGIEAGIQGYQVIAGRREQLVAGMLRDVAITSAVGGALQKSTSTFLADALGEGNSVVSAAVKGVAAGGSGTVAGSAGGAAAVGAPLDTTLLLAGGSVSGVKGGIRGVGSPAGGRANSAAPHAGAPTRVGGDRASTTGWSSRDGGLSDLRSGRPGGSSAAEAGLVGPSDPEAGPPPIDFTPSGTDSPAPRMGTSPREDDAVSLRGPDSGTVTAETFFDQSTATANDHSASRRAPVDSVAPDAAASIPTATPTASVASSGPGGAGDASSALPSATATGASDLAFTSGSTAEAVRPYPPQTVTGSTGADPLAIPSADVSDGAAAGRAGAQQPPGSHRSAASGLIPTNVARRRAAAHDRVPPGDQASAEPSPRSRDRSRRARAQIDPGGRQAAAVAALAQGYSPGEADGLGTAAGAAELFCARTSEQRLALLVLPWLKDALSGNSSVWVAGTSTTSGALMVAKVLLWRRSPPTRQ